MLDWKKVDGVWLENGFRIHRVAPGRWELEEGPRHSGSVTVEPELIAALPTFAACKHKAEALHTRMRLDALRRRLSLIGVAGWAVALIAGNPIVFIAAGVLGSAALLELAATYLEDRTGGARDLTQ